MLRETTARESGPAVPSQAARTANIPRLAVGLFPRARLTVYRAALASRSRPAGLPAVLERGSILHRQPAFRHRKGNPWP
jgi:hypothetical protein